MSEVRFGSHYRVEETLGSGALAAIYRAVDERTTRNVAIKALKSQIAATSSFGEQLDREAKVLADLAHPNVVLLIEAGRAPSGRPFLVLEHVDGPSLERIVSGEPTTTARGRPRKRPLSVAEALAVAVGVCAALEHVHARGIVHRDVKPGNILLARSGVVKLIDFGIAQRPRTFSLSDALGTEGITASGRMAPEQLKDAFGTPAYMSPEQILGDFADGRSDLFSLGVVLYQMLSGTRPFDAPEKEDGKRSAAQRIRRDAAPALRERAPACPRNVERIVMRLLEKSPNDRFPSAGIVRERLEAALRVETREDPGNLVKHALAASGFGPPGARLGSIPPRPSAAPRTKKGGRALGLRHALGGFALIGALFSLGAAANEGGRSRGALTAGAGGLVAPRTGGLRVVATPWAQVRVDGTTTETTPFARPIPLAPGKHWVTLVHPDAPAVEREIEIVAGETVMLEVTLDVNADAGSPPPGTSR